MFKGIFISMIVFTSLASASPEAYDKLSTNLQMTIQIAESEGVDLSSVFVLGLAKVSGEIETIEEAQSLFPEGSARVRMLIPSAKGGIISYESSLEGVLAAAESEDVISIEMSKVLDGTAGITVRN